MQEIAVDKSKVSSLTVGKFNARAPATQPGAQCVPSDARTAKLYLREYAGEEERPPCREEWRRQEWGGRGRLPQVDRSPSRRSPYLARDDEPSPAPDERGRSASAGAHRARPRPLRYQSLERDYERSYAPPPPPDDEYYRREPPPLFLGELQSQNSDLQRELGNLKKELELTNQKLGSSMHSIKTFWSPELKKERALRKEESAKYSLINDQLKLLNQENQPSLKKVVIHVHCSTSVEWRNGWDAVPPTQGNGGASAAHTEYKGLTSMN
ncbi:hypothetical protein ACJJTC_004247 [Scirpophaga incertulas]